MKRNKKGAWMGMLFAAAVLLCFSGCGGGEKEETKAAESSRSAEVSAENTKETGAAGESRAENVPEAEALPEAEGVQDENMVISISDNGAAGKDGIVLCTDKMMFYDYKAGAVYPLCNRPNCRHDADSECAALLGKARGTAFLYDDTLYYMDGMGEGWTLCSSDVSGENQRELAQFGDIDGIGGNFVVTDGKFYCSGMKTIMENYDDDRPTNIEQMLLEVDLETGEVKTLLKCDEGASGRVIWEVCHAYGGKVYMAVQCRDAAGGDILEDGIYAIDTVSGEAEPVVQEKGLMHASWRGRKAVYYQYIPGETRETMLTLVDLVTGETEELAPFENGYLYDSILLDGTFIWGDYNYTSSGRSRGWWKSCSLSDHAVESFLEITPQGTFLDPRAAYVNDDGKEMIFGTSYMEKEDGEGVNLFVAIPAEKFLKGSMDYQTLLEWNY